MEMTTVFKTTLGPILDLGKIFGLINISYTLESGGLLIQNILVILLFISRSDTDGCVVNIHVSNLYRRFLLCRKLSFG